MDKEGKGFYYSYSSVKQREIERIVSKYTDNSEMKYQQLVRLDDSVETTATVFTIIYTVVSILVFGFGLSMILVFERYIFGGFFCVLGICMLFFISKVRKAALDNRRKKVAPKILEIAKEISELSAK